MNIMGRRIRVSRYATWHALGIALAMVLGPVMLHAMESGSQVVIRELRGQSLSHTLIGTDPVRKLAVYLPAGYENAAVRYPVLYYLPNPLAKFDQDFYSGQVRELLDRAVATAEIDKVIFVAVDMATPLGCSWYVNSPVTGNWEDFMVREIVPYVDSNFRTLAARDSRGIAGDFMGGYGAIRFGMTHPEVFGIVYALHPVGTGSGIYTMYSRPDWKLLTSINSLDQVNESPLGPIFTSIFQASVPDVNRPPLYIDLQAHPVGDAVEIDSAVTERLRDNFLLETMIGKYADNLKSLRGLRFDWARNDANQDHVYSNQAFTHKLNEFGIPHEAEEYNGVWGTGNWGMDGRVYTEVLPFFARHLVFEASSTKARRD
jgi:Putative esterase